MLRSGRFKILLRISTFRFYEDLIIASSTKHPTKIEESWKMIALRRRRRKWKRKEEEEEEMKEKKVKEEKNDKEKRAQ